MSLLRLRHSGQDGTAQIFDVVGMAEESILVYAYILIYCFKNQGCLNTDSTNFLLPKALRTRRETKNTECPMPNFEYRDLSRQ